MSEFIERHLGVSHCTAGIHIRCTEEVPRYERTRIMSVNDLLSHCLERVDGCNQLGNGYLRGQGRWFTMNTSRNIFRTVEWDEIFDILGDEYSVFILTRCEIVVERRGNLILVAGRFYDLFASKQGRARAVRREQLFKSKCRLRQLSADDMEEALCGDLKIPKSVRENMGGLIGRAVGKYNKIAIKAAYDSFFNKRGIRHKSIFYQKAKSHESAMRSEGGTALMHDSGTIPDIYASGAPASGRLVDDAVDPQLIVDFLFALAKQFLGPLLRYEEFKILKGKLTLLLKRNVYENVSGQELRKYFRIERMRLFPMNARGWRDVKSKGEIVERLLLYIFDNVFVPIVSFFFYSTPCAGLKYKIVYFARTAWNRRTSGFLKEHLRNFAPTQQKLRAATIRCIPKGDSFRVITNCSTTVTTPDGTADKPADRPWRGITPKYMTPRYARNIFSLNTHLHKLLPILQSACASQSFYNYSEIRRSLYRYLGQTAGRQYILRMDVKKCFDNIPHEDLHRLIADLFGRDRYYSSEYKVLQDAPVGESLEIKTVRRTFDMIYPIDHIGAAFALLKQTDNSPNRPPQPFHASQQTPSAQDILRSTAAGSRIVKEHRHYVFRREALHSTLERFLNNTIVYHQGQYYRMTRGIPQGCCISPFLSGLYLNHIETEYFRPVFRRGSIFRYADDFFIATPLLSELLDFLRVTRRLESRGLFFNRDKVEHNLSDADMARLFARAAQEGGTGGGSGAERNEEESLDHDKYGLDRDDETVSYKSDAIYWCGLRISDCGIGIKYAIRDGSFRYSVAVPADQQGRKIFSKLSKAFVTRTSALYINRRNSRLGECIFDAFFFFGRRLRILFLRASFINRKYIRWLCDWSIRRMKDVLATRRIRLDEYKIDEMASRALAAASAVDFDKKPWT